MAYQRSTYRLRRFEVVAPHVRNDGTPSGYRDAMRTALAAAGFTGWTEVQTVGYWLGKLEEGTTFVIFARGRKRRIVRRLEALARPAMPDQDAIQVVCDRRVTLREA